VLDSSWQRIEDSLAADAVVLDVGGWAKPLARADWVIDLLPYATRQRTDAAERFSEATWVARDICDHDPWPFRDHQFDFATCVQTLEDVRDPVWVCAELSRVARAGYVETPSRLQEQSYSVVGPLVGWSHHRWLVDLADGGLDFVHKPHHLHASAQLQLTTREGEMLTPEERVNALFWTDRLPARERIFVGESSFDEYLESPIRQNRERLQARIPAPPTRRQRLVWQIRNRRLNPPHGTWR
jgi:hypothetical protein